MNDLKNKAKRISDCKASLETQLEEAVKTLASLQAESPRLLACFHLEEVTRAEVDDHKGKVAELETFIGEAKAGLQGLEILATECRQALSKEAKVESHGHAKAHYEELKAKISALGDPLTYNRWLESNFRAAAATLGKQKEADEILRDLQKKRDHRSWSAEPEICQPVN